MFNPLENGFFTVYESVEPPKRNTTIKFPLGEEDIGTWGYIGNNGVIIANNNLNQDQKEESSKLIVNNSEEVDMTNNNYSVNNYSINPSSTGRPRQAVEFFKSKLINEKKLDEQTATRSAMAIVGNLMHESGDITLNNTSALGDKGTAYGMGQWRFDRRKALERFAKKRGKPMSDFNTQLEFTWDEITGSQKHYKVLEGLINSKSLEEATESFMRTFERPNSNPKIHKLSDRIKYAKSLNG